MVSASRPLLTPGLLAALVLAAAAIATTAGCRRPAPTGRSGNPQTRADAAAPGAPIVAGVVTDSRSVPVPGARVLLWSRDQGVASPPQQTIADAGGRFTFPAARPGALELLVAAPGFPSVRLAAPPSPGTPVAVRLDGVAQSITGSVLDGGAPVAGALVILDGETVEPQRLVETAAAGHFAFGGLGPGAYTVRTIRGARASRPSPEIILSRAGPAAPPAHLTLEAGFTLAGRVVGSDGPLPDSEIRIASTTVADIAHADRAGAWTSRALPSGEYRLTARRPGYVARRIVTVVLGSGDTPKSITLELVRGAGVTGRVVDRQGRGVRGAVVRCLAPGPIDLAVITEPLPSAAEAAAVPASAGRLVATARSALTDGGGRFQLADLVPGKVRLDVTAAGHVPIRSDEIPLSPGQERPIGDLVLPDGMPVTGRVLDEFRSPLEGARVATAEGPFTFTDGAGHWSLSLPPAPHTLTISATGMRNQAITVAPVEMGGAGAPPAPSEVVMTRADAALEGIVQDTGGRPIARALIAAWPAAATGPGAGDGAAATRIPDGASILATTVTDVGGHFRLGQLPRVPLVLEVRQSAYPSVKAAATPGTFARVAVPIPGAIAGDVHDARTGAALSRFRVEARGPDGRTASATPRKTAAFVLTALAPGPWTLTVDAPGYEPGELTVDVPPSPTLGEPSVRDRRVDLQPLH